MDFVLFRSIESWKSAFICVPTLFYFKWELHFYEIRDK